MRARITQGCVAAAWTAVALTTMAGGLGAAERATLRTIPPPARVGGTVTVNGVELGAGSSAVRVVVARVDGSSFEPVAEDGDGLNGFGWYALDIPIYDAQAQPQGATQGQAVVIHLFLGGEEVALTTPPAGAVVVGASGSVTRLDLATTSASWIFADGFETGDTTRWFATTTAKAAGRQP